MKKEAAKSNQLLTLMTTQVVFGSGACVKKKGGARTFLTTADAKLLPCTASHDRCSPRYTNKMPSKCENKSGMKTGSAGVTSQRHIYGEVI